MAYISQQPIGTQLFHVREVTSTNDYLNELAAAGRAVHGAVVTTSHQSRGRGEGGSEWESETDKNIQLSLLIVPPTILPDEQVYINLFAALAVFDMINGILPGRAWIKWPNDIYVEDRKIAGILIENSVQGNSFNSSIIGIGININQAAFTAPKAISLFTLTRKVFDVDACISDLIRCLNVRYDQLSLHLKYKLRADYEQVMYKKNEKALFRANDQIIQGEIQGIDDSGKLKLKNR